MLTGDHRRMEEVFESAVEHVIDGRIDPLRDLIERHPALISARSPRPHRATLLHYIAANGVEDHRQRTPPSAVEIARLLIARGADIHARAEFYGSGAGSTPLVGLVTSIHPHEAGLMCPLIRAFAESKQPLDDPAAPGTAIFHAFMFRYVEAAKTLADCGVPILYAYIAAGLGEFDRLDELLTGDHPPSADPGPLDGFYGQRITPMQAAEQALVLAAMGGHDGIVAYLLDRGVPIDSGPYKGWSALHEAAYAGRADTVRLLLERGASTDRRDRQWNATPAEWAAHAGHGEIAALLAGRLTETPPPPLPPSCEPPAPGRGG